MQGCTKKKSFRVKRKTFGLCDYFYLPATFFPISGIHVRVHWPKWSQFLCFLRQWKIHLSSFCVRLSAILKDKPQLSCRITTQVCPLVYQPNPKREGMWAADCPESSRASLQPAWGRKVRASGNTSASALAMSLLTVAFSAWFPNSCFTSLFCALQGDCRTPSSLQDLWPSHLQQFKLDTRQL